MFPNMSAFDRLGLEAGDQRIRFAKLDLGTFVIDGSTVITIGGEPYSARADNALAAAAPDTTFGDSQTWVDAIVSTSVA